MSPLLLSLACSGGPGAGPDADLPPEGLHGTECAVCAMDVADQPAPRGQVLHRGGERRFACSIGDLRVLLQTPSPLGRPERVWVEISPEPDTVSSAPRPWIPAEDAWFVFGLRRPEVMGHPALAYPDRAAAEDAAATLHAHVVPWTAVLDTPFHEIPHIPQRLEEVP